MQQSPICTLDELAGWFKVQPRHAARVFRKLSDEHGFPRPLPGPPNRWSRAMVLAWLNSPGGATAAPEPPPAPVLDSVEAARQRLHQRYVA